MIEQLKNQGNTILYASHYMEEIEQLCDKAAFLDRGEIVEEGSLDELLNKHVISSVFIKAEDPLPEEIHGYGTVVEKAGGYVIQTKTPLDTMEKLIFFAKENESLIDRLELVKPRLEDVFFSLTGNQLRD